MQAQRLSRDVALSRVSVLAPIRVGTAGWSIPSEAAADLPGEGSHLQRYARIFPVAEINSSFHRPHRTSTYERWAASVPTDFRFSVKLPKAITHARKLVDCGDLLARFADEVVGLGSRRGPILIQLPPSLAFDRGIVARFFAEAIRTFGPSLVCEPRHASWFDREPDHLLADLQVARVAADPALSPDAARPGGWAGLAYFRLHGTPTIYRSAYDRDALGRYRRKLDRLHASGVDCWMIFDNTASGAAMVNALHLSRW